MKVKTIDPQYVISTLNDGFEVYALSPVTNDFGNLLFETVDNILRLIKRTDCVFFIIEKGKEEKE